jgi:hypothetical protein
MGLKEIMTKPLWLGSTELAWKEPPFYHIRLRRDALWRLLICVGIGLVAAGFMLGASSFRNVPRDWNFALAVGPIAFLVALLCIFGRQGPFDGRVVLHRDTIRRTTVSCGAPFFIVWSWESWEYDQISKCVFIPAKTVGHRFTIMLVSYGDSQDMIAIPKRVDLRKVVEILMKHGVRVLRGSRLPQHTTQGLSFRAPTLTVAGGLIALMVGLVLYSTQRPPEENLITQRPPIPGLDEMRDTRFPSFAPPTNLWGTSEPTLPEDRPNQELDDMRQMRDGMRRMGGGMRQMGSGIRRERPPSFSSPAGPPGPAAPSIPRSDNTQAVSYVLTETVGSTKGFDFRKVDYRGRPVIGVQFALMPQAGTEYVRRLTPIFDRSRATRPNTILAKEGYALGAIHVWTSEFVAGVKLEFMKLNDDTSLQLSDSYEADTIGTATTETAKIITTDGRLIIGLHGRRTSLMNAIGLVLRK